MAKALAVGSKAGHASWVQIVKDVECPARALGLHPVRSKRSVNDQIRVADSGEDEWRRSGTKQEGPQGDERSIWG